MTQKNEYYFIPANTYIAESSSLEAYKNTIFYFDQFRSIYKSIITVTPKRLVQWSEIVIREGIIQKNRCGVINGNIWSNEEIDKFTQDYEGVVVIIEHESSEDLWPEDMTAEMLNEYFKKQAQPNIPANPPIYDPNTFYCSSTTGDDEEPDL